ncbi:hypothetical protein C8J56DRAFT_1170499 [Mycena floridula]|nr:hypothetical protein C8J56DRAFT_1170499 [Mycena floridula]
MIAVAARGIRFLSRRSYATIGALHAKLASTNQHFYTGPNGETGYSLSFASELLGLPGDEGYGYAQIEFNDWTGKPMSHCQKTGAELLAPGWREISSKDRLLCRCEDSEWIFHQSSKSWSSSRAGSSAEDVFPEPSPHCLQLLSSFQMAGKGTAGEHLCPYTNICLARRILLHTLRGIAYAHLSGIPGCIIKRRCSSSKYTIPEISKGGIMQSAVSQPLPLSMFAKAMKRTFLVADFGNVMYSSHNMVTSSFLALARLVDEILQEDITSLLLRPPEVLVGGPWDKNVDIWTFGCLIFKIIPQKELFVYKQDGKHHLDEMTHIPYQMHCFTGFENEFPAHVLQSGRRGIEYFETTYMSILDISAFLTSLTGQL